MFLVTLHSTQEVQLQTIIFYVHVHVPIVLSRYCARKGPRGQPCPVKEQAGKHSVQTLKVTGDLCPPTWKAVRMYCVRMKGLSCLLSICWRTSVNSAVNFSISFSLLPAARRSATACITKQNHNRGRDIPHNIHLHLLQHTPAGMATTAGAASQTSNPTPVMMRLVGQLATLKVAASDKILATFNVPNASARCTIISSCKQRKQLQKAAR